MRRTRVGASTDQLLENARKQVKTNSPWAIPPNGRRSRFHGDDIFPCRSATIGRCASKFVGSRCIASCTTASASRRAPTSSDLSGIETNIFEHQWGSLWLTS